MTRLARSALDRVLLVPARRPRAALCAALALTVLAVLSVSRIRPDPSIESMFNRDDPSARALVRVLNGFGAAEELLVLAVVPEDLAKAEPPEASAQRLLAFAGRLEAGIAGSPEASAMADGVAYRADPEMRRFVEQVLVPSGLFYLDDAAFAEARRRLTPEGMREQIGRNAAALAQPGPAAQALAKVLAKDPLRLHEFVLDRVAAPRGAFRTFNGGEDFVSPDGRALLIRIAGVRPPSDLEFSKGFTAAVRSVADAANADGLDVRYSGSYAIAATSERAIRRDMTVNVVSAVLFLLGLFVVASRSPLRTFALAFLPVALGTLLGFGAYAAFFPTLTPLTGAVGAILAGLGIDYTIHYLSHYHGRRAAGLPGPDAVAATALDLGPAMLAAWFTSVIGFLAIGWSRVGALRDFALLGSLGLAGSFVAALLVLPAALALFDRRTGGASGRPGGARFDFAPLAGWIGRRGGPVLAAGAMLVAGAAGVLAFTPGELLPLESDLTVMHPRPNPALEAQGEIARRFGAAPSSILVHLRADSPEELVTLSHQVAERLSADAVRHAGVTATVGLASLLPDPRVAAARRDAIDPDEPARVAADFRAVIADSPFDAAAYEPYAKFLQHLLSQRIIPGPLEVQQYPSLARMVLPVHTDDPGALPTEALTLVFLSTSADSRATRDAVVSATRGALAGLPGATVTGMTVLSHDTEAEVRRELPRLFGTALLVVTVYLLVHFRSLADALLAMLPTAFSLLCLLTLMRLTGQKLNLMNLVALPLLIGIDVDYGIFLVSMARSARGDGGAGDAAPGLSAAFGSACFALVMCAGTTLLGFGSLITTSVPAVQSLGFVVGAGVVGCLYATLFILAPLLLWRAGRPPRHSPGRAETPASSPAPALP